MRYRSNRSSIKHKFFITQITLILIAVISFYTISSIYIVSKTKSDTKSSMQYSAEINIANINTYLADMQNVLNSASYDTPFAEFASSDRKHSILDKFRNTVTIQDTLPALSYGYSFPLNIVYYIHNDSNFLYDGKSIISINTAKQNSSFPDVFTNDISFKTYARLDDNQKPLLCIITPIYNVTDFSKVVGYCEVSVEAGTISKMMNDIVMDNSDNAVFDANGAFLCSVSGMDYSNICKSIKQDLNGKELKSVKIKGKNYFAINCTDSSSGLEVVVFTRSNKVYTSAYVLIVALFIILAFICAIAFFFTNMISASMINTLSLLISTMRKSEQGDLKPININTNNRDELYDAIISYNHMINHINALIEHNNNSAEALRKYEFDFLQMQIKPHFLYNTLDSIQFLTRSSQVDEATNLIKNLSKFYKISLHNKSDFVKIENEIKHIKYYVAIENYKHPDSITLNIQIDSEIQNYLIPKITFQPLVENAIKHGILEKDNPVGTINITAEKVGDDIVIYITDDGIGITKEHIDKIKSDKLQGMGLMNTDKRLKLYYGDDYGIDIDSIPNKYTKIIIKIKGVKFDDKDNDC